MTIKEIIKCIIDIGYLIEPYNVYETFNYPYLGYKCIGFNIDIKFTIRNSILNIMILDDDDDNIINRMGIDEFITKLKVGCRVEKINKLKGVIYEH